MVTSSSWTTGRLAWIGDEWDWQPDGRSDRLPFIEELAGALDAVIRNGSVTVSDSTGLHQMIDELQHTPIPGNKKKRR